MLFSCAAESDIAIQNEKLTFLKTTAQSEYAGIAAADGNQILALRFLAESENPDLSVITEGFFGETPSVVDSGADTYACKSIAFEKENGRIIAVPLFEVPLAPEGGTTYTLSGNAFSPIRFAV
jgi:hypothetical protein